MKKEIIVTVFCEDEYNKDWPPENAVGFVEWFAQKLEQVPVEYRSKATIALDSVGSYEDSHYVNIGISYSRPETDKEEQNRLAYENNKMLRLKENELRTLAELKAKYEENNENLHD